MRESRLRRAPKRFGYPPGILDVFRYTEPSPCPLDVVFDSHAPQYYASDFYEDGSRGCSFEMATHEFRAYRARNRHRRVAWSDLSDGARAAILRYMES